MTKLCVNLCLHRSPEPLFCIRVPVAAIELEKDRSVGDGHVCFDDQYAEGLGSLIEFVNDLLMRNVCDVRAIKHGLEVFAIVSDAGCIDVRNKDEFLVGVDVGTDVSERGNGIMNVAHNPELIGSRDDNFDADPRLRRISSVRNDDPVAMTEEREEIAKLGLPICGCGSYGVSHR